MRIVMGSDHAGYRLKEKIKAYLIGKGIDVIDVGTYSEESCDYPDYAIKAVKRYFNSKADFGILICGSGIGMSIVANKFRGIRAAVVYSEELAILSRKHNHANFLCLGARFLDDNHAIKIVDTWLNTEEEHGRHERRVNKIRKLEKNVFKENYFNGLLGD